MIIFTIVGELLIIRNKTHLKPGFVTYPKNTGASMVPVVSSNSFKKKAAGVEVLDYITYYNADRLHSTLGYKTPFEYEKELFRNAA